MSRLEILWSFRNKECVNDCAGEWLTIATNILQRNDIPIRSFTSAVYQLLEKGRGKYRNLMITGPANCGKTFILLPLTLIYNSFCNPASTSFAWVGAETGEIIFLNDFRWSPQIMPWHDLLLLLSGTTPVFATGKHPLVLIKGGQVDEVETEMMAVRWKQFSFKSQIPENEQRQIPPCGACFAKPSLIQQRPSKYHKAV